MEADPLGPDACSHGQSLARQRRGDHHQAYQAKLLPDSGPQKPRGTTHDGCLSGRVPGYFVMQQSAPNAAADKPSPTPGDPQSSLPLQLHVLERVVTSLS